MNTPPESLEIKFKICMCCGIEKPETAFWVRGKDNNRRATCGKCCKGGLTKISDATHPVVTQIIELLEANGPMTADELSDFIPGRNSRYIGSAASRIRKLGLIDRVLPTTNKKPVTWFIPVNAEIPIPIKNHRNIEFKTKGLDDTTDLKAKRKSYPVGMTEDDYVWMQKYRAQAELKKVPRTERARSEYTA